MITCKKASEYSSQMEYTKLSFGKKLELLFHMGICKSCRLVAKQLNLMKKTIKDPEFEESFLHKEEDCLTPECKEKMKQAMKNTE